jgi:hypothetical protein
MSEFDYQSERCYDCDGHFRHFPGCSYYREDDSRNNIPLEIRLEVESILRDSLR